MRVNRLYPLVAIIFLLAGMSAFAQDSDPSALVKSNVEEVLSVLKQSKDKQALHDLAEQKIASHFDFQRMTRLALGKSWAQASPDQQQRLEKAFRGLLVRTYTTALSLSNLGDVAVEVRPAQANPGQDDVTVKSVTRQSGKQPVAMDYRLSRTTNGWKVYDVVVENLSLVTNYRDSFSSEIGRSGIDGLIKTIEAKNNSLAGT
jgi:phospholipid transport system substrate-binding protein